MRPGVGPGPASLEGLRWLCTGRAGTDRCVGVRMGWAPGNARSHAARLTRERVDEPRRATARGGFADLRNEARRRVAGVDVAARRRCQRRRGGVIWRRARGSLRG